MPVLRSPGVSVASEIPTRTGDNPYFNLDLRRPSGKGWKLTFTTPDQEPAETAGQVSLNVTCAVPQ